MPWTPEIEAAFLTQIRRGNYVETACQLVGLPKSSLYWRLKRGRAALETNAEHPDALFVLAVEGAQAEAEDRLRAIVDKAAEGHEVTIRRQEINPRTGEVVTLTETRWEYSWQAAITRLERMHPERYQRRKTENIEREVRERIEVQILLPDNGRGALTGEVIDADCSPAGAPESLSLQPGDDRDLRGGGGGRQDLGALDGALAARREPRLRGSDLPSDQPADHE